MKKSTKKTLCSLAVAVLVSSGTTLAHAASFSNYNLTYYPNYNRATIRRTSTYNYSNRYSNNYYTNSNRYSNSYYTNSNRYSNNYYYTNNNRYSNSYYTNNNKYSNDNKTTNNDSNSNKNTTNTNSSNYDKSTQSQVANLTNQERSKRGLKSLSYNQELSKVAQAKAEDMASKGYFSHNSPTYKDPFTMMKSFGIKYRTGGENIARGYSSPQSVVDGWMNSSGHRANILSSNFNKIGVGHATDRNGKQYWVQMFTD